MGVQSLSGGLTHSTHSISDGSSKVTQICGKRHTPELRGEDPTDESVPSAYNSPRHLVNTNKCGLVVSAAAVGF